VTDHGVPRRHSSQGFRDLEYLWTFNRQRHHGHIRLRTSTCALVYSDGRTRLRSFQSSSTRTHPASGVESRRAQFCIDKPSHTRRCVHRRQTLATTKDPVPARELQTQWRDAAGADPQDGMGHGRIRRVLTAATRCPMCNTVEPALLRGRRPGDAGHGGSATPDMPSSTIYRHHAGTGHGRSKRSRATSGRYMFGFIEAIRAERRER